MRIIENVKTNVSVSLNAETLTKLNEFCKENKIQNRSSLIENLVIDLISKPDFFMKKIEELKLKKIEIAIEKDSELQKIDNEIEFYKLKLLGFSPKQLDTNKKEEFTDIQKKFLAVSYIKFSDKLKARYNYFINILDLNLDFERFKNLCEEAAQEYSDYDIYEIEELEKEIAEKGLL